MATRDSDAANTNKFGVLVGVKHPASVEQNILKIQTKLGVLQIQLLLLTD